MDQLGLNRLELRPKYEDQTREFAIALDKAWRQGFWTIFLDELWYLDKLGLRDLIERLLTQGSGKGVRVVMGMQRPLQVTRFALSQSVHVISFGMEGRDAKELGLATSQRFGEIVAALAKYEFAWFNRGDKKRIWVGRIDLASGAFVGAFV